MRVIMRIVLPKFDYELEDEYGLEAFEDRDRFGEFEILGTDDRQLVTDTDPIPFRFVCCLESLFRGRGLTLRARGTGTLISDRHVLTAAHVVLDNLPQLGGRAKATSILVAPGRNGMRMPFSVSAATARIPAEWVRGPSAQFDFALLRLGRLLRTPANPIGFWSHPRLGGGTRIRPIDLRVLGGAAVNLSGYPIDKCLDQPPGRPATPAELAACDAGIRGPVGFFTERIGTTQWRCFGNIIDPAPATEPRSITFDLDSAAGHSGGPVWLNWEGFRNLLAVNTGGFPRPTAPFDIVANMGVRITEPVLKQLRTWMRADGITPTF
jgi:V8-like Glu-specific endopeptidase